MASSQNTSLLQCTGCHDELNLESKTLPCLHSFCRSCLDSHFKGETDKNGQCPECQEPLALDQLRLSPFLVNYFKRRQLESTDLKCDLCLEDEIQSPAINWCDDCKQLHCAHCSRIHKKFNQKHNARHLDEMERDELMKLRTGEVCSLHQKIKDSYCVECDVCLCDACYKSHSAGPPGCSSQPLSVREEASKQRSQGPTLMKEMDDLEMSLKRLIERTQNYTEELSSECDSKCRQLWLNYEETRDNIKQKTSELCEEMKEITDEQVKRWRQLLEENERILKQLKVWRLHLDYSLIECQQDVEVVRGLRMLGSKLSSGRLHRKPQEKCHLGLTFPNWWLEVLEQLKTEIIGSVSLTSERLPGSIGFHPKKKMNDPEIEEQKMGIDIKKKNQNKEQKSESPTHPEKKMLEKKIKERKMGKNIEKTLTEKIGSFSPFRKELSPSKDLIFEEEWNLTESIGKCGIKSIHVCKEDNHVFLCDYYNKSIIEMNRGKVVCSCPLIEGGKRFSPNDMCQICKIVIVVCRGNKLFILQRGTNSSSLKIKTIITTKNQYESISERNELIFVSGRDFIDSITKEGEIIKHIEIRENLFYSPLNRIRFDFSGFFWATNVYSFLSFELICFDSNGNKIRSEEIRQGITDFSVNKKDLFLCNEEGIVSLSTNEFIYKFEEESEKPPRIFVLENKMFVYLKINGKDLIKIFKIIY